MHPTSTSEHTRINPSICGVCDKPSHGVIFSTSEKSGGSLHLDCYAIIEAEARSRHEAIENDRELDSFEKKRAARIVVNDELVKRARAITQAALQSPTLKPLPLTRLSAKL